VWLGVALLFAVAAVSVQLDRVAAGGRVGQRIDGPRALRVHALLAALDAGAASPQAIAALRRELRPLVGDPVVPVAGDLVPALLAFLALAMVLLGWRDHRPAAPAAEAAAAPRAEGRLQYLANVSHEIRTPINTILGFTDVLCNDDPSPEEHVAYLETIRRNGDHLLAIVGDILDLSRVESGQLEVQRVRCRLPDLVHEVAALVRPEAEQKGLDFEAVNRGALPEYVQADPVRLRQVLLNLLTNAVKFTDVGFVTLEVSVDDLGPAGASRVVFEVSDSGLGIAPGQLETLFEPFVQAPGANQRGGGTGLGLAIARRFARMLGGDVTAESRPDEGSRFTATIDPGPLENATMLGADEALVARETPVPPERIRVSGRVLLVEDGPDTQRLVAHFLRHAGARVWVAGDGREGFETAVEAQRSGAPFHLLLMDMEMPEMNGYEATRRLRGAGVRTPVVALTAYAEPEEQEAALAAGCNEVVSKPVPRAVLLDVVRRYLQPDEVATVDKPETTMSDLIGGPELDTLTRMFVSVLEQRVGEMEAALADREAVRLQRLAHRLKGAAGSYGFAGISDAAAAVEAAARSGEDAQTLLAALRAACHHARVSYARGSTRSGAA
jgi:signal transduction histidine kinase/CheY-like chemotaxis protein/HPt (histidine-containing phosphotransfer) domain-containing protein